MKQAASGTEDLDDEPETCIVCCNELNVFALGPCVHTSVCAECVIRLRVLFDKTECAVCKGAQPMLAITRNPASEECKSIVKGMSDGAAAGFRFVEKYGLYCDGDELSKWCVCCRRRVVR